MFNGANLTLNSDVDQDHEDVAPGRATSCDNSHLDLVARKPVFRG